MELMDFISQLEARGLCPRNIEVSEWDSWTLASAFDDKCSHFISESVSMGIDKDPEIAILKALTEFCERRIAKNCNDFQARITERSDGFAAFPVLGVNDEESKFKASENAFNEAIERYLWAKWWDDDRVQYSVEELNLDDVSDFHLPLLREQFKLLNIKQIIIPNSTLPDRSLTILLAEKSNGGFVTGGAAGGCGDRKQIIVRAFGELLRHLLVLEKMESKSHFPRSFYENRLYGFGSGAWSGIVRTRLRKIGKRVIDLPPLSIHKSINHSFQDIVSVHRCLFRNAAPFIGGSLERLCI